MSGNDECPEMIGSYKVERPLGVGGMGHVYAARHKSLNISVAIKVFHNDILEKPSSAKRFIQEARLAASIEHINLVRVLECGNDEDDHPYYVMEMMASSILHEMKRKGAYTERVAIDIGESVARGLMEAHKHKIIHRDIKPDNIMISQDGLYKLCDLGLAKVIKEQEKFDAKLTVQGSGLGTPQFMAPEQAMDAGSVDERADIFSVGASLYFAVTGQKPFPEGDIRSILTYHMTHGAPDPSKLKPELSRAFCDLVMKCMAVNMEDRYATAKELKEALGQLRLGHHDSLKPIHFDTCVDITESSAMELEKFAVKEETERNMNTIKKSGCLSLFVIGLMLYSTINFMLN